jgi:hypothetical protein
MKFSVKYIPTSLFSLKDSNSTNSGAKSLFVPSSYAIKMAILNQAITIGGELELLQTKSSKEFGYVRDAKIEIYIEEGSFFSVNNSFVKILKPAREGGGFGQTVAFREYLYLSNPLEIIFEVESEQQKSYLKKYLHKINYFGKRGCFFQFIEYMEEPNEANVIEFSSTNLMPGIIQEYDDFDSKATFDHVNSFSESKTKRAKKILLLPIATKSSSKSFRSYNKI